MQGEGYRRGGFEGFPRFQKCVFKGEYPFGEAQISDSSVPLQVSLSAWNPFIPLDDKDSGIPCAILEYTLHNRSARTVEYEFSYHLSHLAPGCGEDQSASRNTVIPERGVFLHNVEKPNAEGYGSASLTAIGYKPRIKGMWLRSPGWEFDSLSALWREVSTGTFTANEGSNEIDTSGRNGGSILLAGLLAPGESRTHPIVIAWHFPNCYLQVGGARARRAPRRRRLSLFSRGHATALAPLLCLDLERRPRSSSLRRRELRLATSAHAGVQGSTVFLHSPAAMCWTLFPRIWPFSNLPPCLRLENGDLWGWEGCFPDAGCCHGSCTHVWNYAQAFPHLYPQLERTLRELELVRSMDENGHVTFRSALPEGPVKHDFHAASDGQLGGIMKVFRDWQISGDIDWLRKMYPLAKRSLDYCIRTWDPDHQGGLFEPHHNTYDIEFWGPDGMCTSIYLGALSAMAEMARAVGSN